MYFTVTFYKHSDSSVHSVISLSDRPVSEMKGEDNYLLFEFSWVRVIPEETIEFHNQLVPGIIKGILSLINKPNTDSILKQWGKELSSLKAGSHVSQKFIIPLSEP